MRSVLPILLVAAIGCGGENNNNGSDMAATGQDMAGTDDMSGDMKKPVTTCDVGAQTGCQSGEKCVPTQGGTQQNPTVVGKCVADGTVLEGASCTRTSGMDDCKGGMLCTSLANNMASSGTAVSVCRKICGTPTSCGGTQKCADLFGESYGLCLPTCTPFGTDCGTGFDCGYDYASTDSTMSVSNGFFICKQTGAGALFADCMKDSDCGANMWCDSPMQGGNGCTPECNGAHPCPQPGDGGAPLTCAPYDNTNGAGYCSTQ